MASTNVFKLSIIGDGATGKTAFAQKHRTSIFENEYIATMATEIYVIGFKTNKGKVFFNCWDIAGQKKFGGGFLNDYYLNSDAALVFFDFSSKSTLTNTLKWKSEFKSVCTSVPVVLCGNKSDLVSTVDATDIKTSKFDGYCEMSVKTGYNYREPFLKVLKLLMGSDTIII
uniref:Ras family GTPase n=1 Tax=Pithovirus LCPAC001 TaxID=2506585 RepID=A0A481Z1G4_9VIRU|nr:MAG: Ras family GTPase [Pithovirus LCPAC001]